MSNYATLRVRAAGAGARINASHVDAGNTAGTVTVDDTLGAAVR